MDHNEPNPFDIDAPASVGAFLASIPVHMKSHGKNCLNLQDLKNSHSAAEPEREVEAAVNEEVDYALNDTPPTASHSTSAAATPPEGHRAPPPTPASIAAAIENGSKHLEPIPEDGSMSLSARSSPRKIQTQLSPEAATYMPADFSKESVTAVTTSIDATADAVINGTVDTDKSSHVESFISPKTATISAFDAFTEKGGNQGLGASKFAGRNPFGARTRPILSIRDTNTDHANSQGNVKRSSLSSSKVEGGYQDTVVEMFRRQNEVQNSRSMIFKKTSANPGVDTSNHVDHVSVKSLEDEPIFTPTDTDSERKSIMKTSSAAKSTEDVENDAAVPETAIPKRKVTFNVNTVKEVFAQETKNTDLASTAAEVRNDTKASNVKIEPDSDDDVVHPAKKVAEHVATAEDDQNREDATFFSAWGNAQPRSGPKAEKRRVILTNLPTGIDIGTVASLIHGGALETFKLVKSDNSLYVSAVVTFTTGKAALDFYEKYPNGLVIKLNGKKYVAELQLGENVDVISGVMRGYLETGATRVVRAAGADEDWGPRALRKIAEQKGRKLEAIADLSTGQARTIDFRFTNIADAVAFRAHLSRDHDWEDVTITFGEDPCAKATCSRQ